MPVQTIAADEKQTSSNNTVVDSEKAKVPSLEKKYHPTKKPRKKMPGKWRTRKDPFVTVWSDLQLRLSMNPNKTAKSLLDELLIEHPGEFKNNMLRTLQRRVAGWRKKQHEEEKKEHLSLVSKNNPTEQYLSLVMGG